MARPQSIFEDYYCAMEAICYGCPRETGWLEDWENNDTPPCAVKIIFNEDMIEWTDKEWQCVERKQIASEEREKYERRMAGDLS